MLLFRNGEIGPRTKAGEDAEWSRIVQNIVCGMAFLSSGPQQMHIDSTGVWELLCVLWQYGNKKHWHLLNKVFTRIQSSARFITAAWQRVEEELGVPKIVWIQKDMF